MLGVIVYLIGISCEHLNVHVVLSSCVPCPPGSYIDVNTTRCMKCPANTIVHSGNAWGIESCMPCGEGLHTTDNVHCETDCKYKSPDGKDYDFTSLSE